MNNKNILLHKMEELENAVKLENKKILLGKNRHTNGSLSMLQIGLRERGNKEPPLFTKYEQTLDKNALNKENLSLLERGYAEGNEFVKIRGKVRPIKPAIVNEIIETEYKNIKPYDDKYERLVHYAEKYRIPFKRAGVKKTLKELAQDVHRYEIKHIKSLMKIGLDKKYQEYGHYIKML